LSGTVLVVDDQLQPRRLLIDELEQAGFIVTAASDGEEAWQSFCQQAPDVVITDMAMPRCDGLELLRRIRSKSEVPVIVFSGYGSIESATDAFKAGADEFVSSLDLEIEELVDLVRRSIRSPLTPPNPTDLKARLVGDSSIIERLRWQLSGLAPLGAPVFVSGEQGSGRSGVIETLHELGFSSMGSLTLADAGTFAPPCNLSAPGAIHLRDIENLSPKAQEYWVSRLLKAQEVGFEGRLRVFVSTSLPISDLVADGFDPELLRLLTRFHVEVPPLHSYAEDIPQIAQALVQQIGSSLGRSRIRLSPAALEFLSSYRYPGHVNQLTQILERAIAFTRGRVIRRDALKDIVADFDHSVSSIRDQKRALERQRVLQAIRESGGNIAQAADLLSKSRAAVYRLMHKYDIPLKRDV
jgi:DNA-binding NtrC family response regulator